MKTCSLSLIVSPSWYIYAPFLSTVRTVKVIMKDKAAITKNNLTFFKVFSSDSYNMYSAQISAVIDFFYL